MKSKSLQKNIAEIKGVGPKVKVELNKIGIFSASLNFHTEVKANISIKIDKIQSK